MSEQIVEHLKNLISCYPTTNNQPNVHDALEYCLLHLKQTGSFADARIHSVNGVYSLYASTMGRKHSKVMLQAHVDVVPAGENMRSLTISQNKAVGRGAIDMLFATACYLTLAEEISADLNNIDMSMLLTGDEEIGGFNGVGSFVKKNYKGNIVILPDAGEGLGEISTGSKGVYNFDLIVKGRPHHSSRPWLGDGAGNKLVAALTEIISMTGNTRTDPFTVVVTQLSGGDAMNKGPAEVAANIDVRYVDDQALKQFRAKLNLFLHKYNAEVANLNEAECFNLDLTNPLVVTFMETYKKFAQNGNVKLTRTDGSSDARFFAVKGIPVIMFRPKGGDLHGDAEWADVGELNIFYEILKHYVLKIAKI